MITNKILYYIKKIIPAGERGRAGFTLAELLISMTILILVSTVVLANYRYYGNRNDLNMSAQKLANDVRRAQSYALGLTEFAPIGDFPDGGWGIRFRKNQQDYTIFADYDTPSVVMQSNEEFRTEKFMRSGVQITNRVTVYKGGTGTDYNYAWVTFVPPNPIIHILGASNQNGGGANTAECDYVEIELVLLNTPYTKKIIINKYGLVDITD